nr:hypothetical protein [Tanacetum cinerariifolium]
QSLHASRPSRLCAQAQSIDDMPFRKQAYTEYTRWVFCKLYERPNCGPIEFGFKHLLGGVVQAMMSPSGSIVSSLENVNGFLVVNTPPDDLSRTDFKQEGVIPKEENPSEQSRLGIFLRKEIFEGVMIRIQNAFVHDV